MIPDFGHFDLKWSFFILTFDTDLTLCFDFITLSDFDIRIEGGGQEEKKGFKSERKCKNYPECFFISTKM